jgi:hypothetical protein
MAPGNHSPRTLAGIAMAFAGSVARNAMIADRKRSLIFSSTHISDTTQRAFYVRTYPDLIQAIAGSTLSGSTPNS